MEDAADLQFGDLWTHPAHRGLGIAPAALCLAIAARSDRDRTFWYLTHETNVASIRTAERAGLRRMGRAVRTRKLGLSQLGQYELTSQTSPESRRDGRAVTVDYSAVTELGDDLGSRAQLRRAYARYYFAAQFCDGKDVLEVACGGGQGLGHLARRARTVVGLDIDPTNLAAARQTYADRAEVAVIAGDAHDLPFDAGMFDVVLLFEAVYYLRDAERFVREARRVLRPDGTLLVCTANKDVSGFNPGALTHRHFGVRELSTLLAGQGFRTEIFASGALATTVRARAFRASKRAAVRMGLIPNTLKMRAVIKRLFFGPLVRLPREIEEGIVDYDPVVAIPSDAPTKRHEVILAVGRLPGAQPQ
jgi:SAM-dependent methyltransferase